MVLLRKSNPQTTTYKLPLRTALCDKEENLNQYKYDPIITGIFVGLAGLILWYFSTLAVAESLAPKWVEPFLDFFTALCGAFAGAYFAFKFGHKMEQGKRQLEEKKQTDSEVAIINRAILNLAIQLNTVSNIKSEIDSQNSLHQAIFGMHAFKNFHDGARVDVGELALILNNSPQLLLELSIEQDAFLLTLESLKVRNEFYTNTLQPKMSEAGLLDRPCSIAEYESKLSFGDRNTAQLAFQHLNKNVTKSHAGLTNKIFLIRSAAKGIYPNHKFMNIENT
uniref:hypothetical protein n=1 Tax=Cellvibrio fontiphilus TaxID=1815559 RepID=UPI002B4BC212|nr:hypothetical protein [Cellvibrio fontiphilus]